MFAYAFTLADLGMPAQLAIYLIEIVDFSFFSERSPNRQRRAAAKFERGCLFDPQNASYANEVLAV
jgi:hypothetical protein